MSFAEIRGSGLGSVIAENNSTKYYVKVLGTNKLTDSNIGLFVNDKKVNMTYTRGITVSRFTPTMTLVGSQTFDLVANVGNFNRLIDYITTATESIIILQTFDSYYSNEALNTLMNKYGSAVWPSWTKLADASRSISYCALIDNKSKNIVAEALGSRGADYPAQFDYYFDDVNDLGSIGAGKSLVEEHTEYRGKNYTVHMYRDKAGLSSYPQLQNGDWLTLRCDMKRDQEAIDGNIDCRLVVQFYKAGSFLKAVSITEKPGLTYQTFETTQIIPPDSDQLDIGFYHGPSTANGTGTAFVRNVVIQPTNAPVKKEIKNSRLGRFSAPTENFKEGPIGGNTVVRFNRDELLEATEMQELAGGYWIKVMDHNTLNKEIVFDSIEQAFDSEIPQLYSNMKSLEDFRMSNGKFRFKIDYGTEYGTLEWIQRNSPEEIVVTDLEIISDKLINKTQEFYGLKKNGTTARYDGSSGGTWYYAFGATETWNQGIPGAGPAVQQARLYAWKE